MTRTSFSKPIRFNGLAKLGGLAVGVAMWSMFSGAFGVVQAQGELRLGREGSGALSTMDPTMDDSSHYDMWTYSGKAGETIKVTLRSDAFDSYLSVGRMQGGEFDEMKSDDDGAGGKNSKVVINLPEDGEYGIRVNSLSAGETGAYTVIVEQADASEVEASGQSASSGSRADPLPTPTPIHAGQTLTGELNDSDPMMDDSSHYDLFSFSAKRGQQATITMRSTAFDSYLTFGRIEDGSFRTLDSDDDSGGGDDAQVVARITRDGEYAIRTNSLFSNVSGQYTVRLEMGVAPPVVVVPPQDIHYGQTVAGELTASDATIEDDTHADLYKFNGKRGEKLVITMKAAAFDAYLSFGQMNGEEFSMMDSNDDGGGGTDSKIEVTLSADGEYIIRANAVLASGLGKYTLNLARVH